jgi:hypothetical protein
VHSDKRLGVRLIAEEGYRNVSGGKDPNSGLTSPFSTMTMPLHMLYYKFASFWLRNALQKWIIHYSSDLALAIFGSSQNSNIP